MSRDSVMSDSAAVSEMETNPSYAQDGARPIASQSTTDNEDNHFPAARRSRSGTRMPCTCLGLLAMERGEEAVKSDLRELKLTLGECRQLINHLGASK